MRAKILSVLVVFLIGCGGALFANGTQQQPSATSAPKPVTITFTAMSNGPAQKSAFEKIFADFKKATGNTVNLQILPDVNQYTNLIQTRFATDNPPDVFLYFTGPQQYVTLQATKNLVEMSGQPYLSRLTEAVKNFYTQDGKIYGVPYGAYQAMGVLYNTDDFAKVGIKQPPSNYNEFLADCAKLKAAGITPIYDAGKTAWPMQIFSLDAFQTFVIPTIGMSGVQKLAENKLQIKNIPEIAKTLQMQLDLKKDGYFNKDLMSGTYAEQQQALATGSAAMAFQADWILPEIAKTYPQDVNKIGYFALPSDTGPGPASLYPPNQILVSKNGKHVNVALQLINFMTTPKELAVYHADNPGIPIYKGVQSKLYPAQQTIYNLIKENKGIVQIQLLLKANYVNDYPQIVQQLMISGNVNQAIDEMNQKYVQDGKNKHIAGF